MSLIKLLPENLVNQIAAGEVVERPASVIKELVENSIDAGADRILIELKEGGKTFIKVVDNGCGMSKEDLEMSLQRHATSKLANEAGLWNINTMGFRGEALASISSVSKMLISSRIESETSGYAIESHGGNIDEIREVGMSVGTKIEVSDLFYNTPARQKYLKKDATEFARISSLINQIALSNHNVSFKLVHNEKTVFDWAKSSDLLSRIVDVLGTGVADAMIPIFYGGDQLKIDGFIGKPLLSRSSSQHQYIFVNGRSIQHHLLANRIKAAYHSMLMEHKKPVFVLNIQIDPSLIDVNVHPRKLEIRFEDQQSLVKAVYGCVKTALDKTTLIPKGFSESKRYMSDSFPEVKPTERSDSQASMGSFYKPSYSGGNSYSQASFVRDSGYQKQVQESLDFSDQMFTPTQSSSDLNYVSEIKAIAQINNSYIVAKDENGLVIVDQHAGHERVRYEELMDQYEAQKSDIQQLLTPLNIEFSSDEIALINDNINVFEGLGFEIEPFGGNTFVVHAIPNCLNSQDVADVVRGVLDDILNGDRPSKMQGKVEEMLTYMSCRSAIKFGQKLSLPEMQELLDQMANLKRPYTCPHGRPTMVALDMLELDKMFGRK